VDQVTQREFDILRLVATGMTHAAAGDALGIRGQTVKNHLSDAYKRLRVNNQTEAFVALGWLTVPPRCEHVSREPYAGFYRCLGCGWFPLAGLSVLDE